jgi:hypothetical protein
MAITQTATFARPPLKKGNPLPASSVAFGFAANVKPRNDLSHERRLTMKAKFFEVKSALFATGGFSYAFQ